MPSTSTMAFGLNSCSLEETGDCAGPARRKEEPTRSRRRVVPSLGRVRTRRRAIEQELCVHVLECERGHLCVRARCVKTACGSTGRRGRGQRGCGPPPCDNARRGDFLAGGQRGRLCACGGVGRLAGRAAVRAVPWGSARAGARVFTCRPASSSGRAAASRIGRCRGV